MRKHKIAIAAVVLLIVVYLIQSFAIPPETTAISKYHLSSSTARLLKATFTLPLVVVWVVAMVGYIHFSRYASSIKETSDGSAFDKLSNGILALTLWLPTYAVVQNTSSYLWHMHPSITAGAIITTNLINAILLITVTYLLWRGSRELLTSNHISLGAISVRFLYITSAIAASAFTYLVLFNPSRFSPAGNSTALFYLPAWLLIPSFIVPYTAVWYLGLQSMQFIYAYRKYIKGVIYKDALKYIATGIAFSTASALTIRTLSTLSPWFSSLTLKFILITTYGLVFMIGIGYLLLWIGSKKLQLIEEV